MQQRRRVVIILAGLIALAFALRLYRLDSQPLRGDEAFAIRYWAESPSDVITDLSHREPHPFGTFFGFWAWKSLAGSSVFAMRYLPLLASLLGVSASALLGRRLGGSWRTGLIAAALWAVNPYLIWHAQDARNYAIWAAISPLAMWAFLRAVQLHSRRAWVRYILLEAAALYIFFLEAFMLPVQALYLLLIHRRRETLRGAARAWGVLGLLLIPWLIQAWWLAGSEYAGTLSRSEPGRLLTWFIPTLVLGDDPAAPWGIVVALVWLGALIAALVNLASRPNGTRIAWWFAAYLLLPTLLLTVAGTRMSVFHPRYLLGLAAAVLLTWAIAVDAHYRAAQRFIPYAARGALIVIVLGGMVQLTGYYRGSDAKSPDWPSLARYLETHAAPGEIILQPAPDPAFNYYYHGPADETSLLPDQPLEQQLAALAARYRTIWWVGPPGSVTPVLDDTYRVISQIALADFTVTGFRATDVAPTEIEHRTDITFGEFARLAGYSLRGPDPAAHRITLLLYWEPVGQSAKDYKVFVHLLGPPRQDGSPLWSQDDSLPLSGMVSTTTWTPGDSPLRDVYQLDASDLPAGEYRIGLGFYDPDQPGQRVPVYNVDGESLGDQFTIPLPDLPR